MPRGVEKRHPDDAKWWAIVDDPRSIPSQRVMAIKRIAFNEAKRNGEPIPNF